MNKMTIDELHRIITNPDRTKGYELHIKNCWERNRADSIFYITGLDVSHLLTGEPQPLIKITKPR